MELSSALTVQAGLVEYFNENHADHLLPVADILGDCALPLPLVRPRHGLRTREANDMSLDIQKAALKKTLAQAVDSGQFPTIKPILLLVEVPPAVDTPEGIHSPEVAAWARRSQGAQASLSALTIQLESAVTSPSTEVARAATAIQRGSLVPLSHIFELQAAWEDDKATVLVKPSILIKHGLPRHVLVCTRFASTTKHAMLLLSGAVRSKFDHVRMAFFIHRSLKTLESVQHYYDLVYAGMDPTAFSKLRLFLTKQWEIAEAQREQRPLKRTLTNNGVAVLLGALSIMQSASTIVAGLSIDSLGNVVVVKDTAFAELMEKVVLKTKPAYEVAMMGDACDVFRHGVQLLMDAPPPTRWDNDDASVTKLVIIGKARVQQCVKKQFFMTVTEEQELAERMGYQNLTVNEVRGVMMRDSLMNAVATKLHKLARSHNSADIYIQGGIQKPDDFDSRRSAALGAVGLGDYDPDSLAFDTAYFQAISVLAELGELYLHTYEIPWASLMARAAPEHKAFFGCATLLEAGFDESMSYPAPSPASMHESFAYITRQLASDMFLWHRQWALQAGGLETGPIHQRMQERLVDDGSEMPHGRPFHDVAAAKPESTKEFKAKWFKLWDKKYGSAYETVDFWGLHQRRLDSRRRTPPPPAPASSLTPLVHSCQPITFVSHTTGAQLAHATLAIDHLQAEQCPAVPSSTSLILCPQARAAAVTFVERLASAGRLHIDAIAAAQLLLDSMTAAAQPGASVLDIEQLDAAIADCLMPPYDPRARSGVASYTQPTYSQRFGVPTQAAPSLYGGDAVASLADNTVVPVMADVVASLAGSTALPVAAAAAAAVVDDGIVHGEGDSAADVVSGSTVAGLVDASVLQPPSQVSPAAPSVPNNTKDESVDPAHPVSHTLCLPPPRALPAVLAFRQRKRHAFVAPRLTTGNSDEPSRPATAARPLRPLHINKRQPALTSIIEKANKAAKLDGSLRR